MVNPWKIIAASLVIFAAGVVTGGLTVTLGARLMERGEFRARSAPPGSAERLESQQRELLRRMERQLDLSPDQREQARGILKDSQEDLRRAWENVHPVTQQQLRQTRARLREVLNPEQQQKFDESFKARDKGLRDKGSPDRMHRETPRRRQGGEAMNGGKDYGPKSPENVGGEPESKNR